MSIEELIGLGTIVWVIGVVFLLTLLILGSIAFISYKLTKDK